MPDKAWNLESFDLDLDGQQQVECVSFQDEHSWSIRKVQPDVKNEYHPVAVPGRTWTTDISLSLKEEHLYLAVRILCVSVGEAKEVPVDLMRPAIVKDIAKKYGLREIRPLLSTPWEMQSKTDLDELYQLLTNPARTFPIVVLSEPDQLDLYYKNRIDEIDLAESFLGFAHLVHLPKNLEKPWADRVGPSNAVMNGGLRIYWTGINRDEEPATVATPESLYIWSKEIDSRSLKNKMKEHAASKLVNWQGCIFIPEARTHFATLQRKKLNAETNLVIANEKAKAKDHLRTCK